MSGAATAEEGTTRDPRPTDSTADGRAALDVATLACGDRLEHDDGHVWRVVGASARAAAIRMPDGRRVWVDHESLRVQLAGEPVRVVRSD